MKRTGKTDLVAWLREDLKNAEAVNTCDLCGAPFLLGDQWAADDDGVAACWPSVGPKEGKGKPCYAYRLAPDELKAPPRPEVPYVPPYQRTTSLARGEPLRGVDRYMTPEISARLKRLSK